MTTIERNTARGFALLEVLIALVLFAVGLLGLARLQGTLLRGGADAKARTGAVVMAQRKLEDLRRYTVLVGGTGSYKSIGNNAGGTIAAGDTTVAGVTYTLGWKATDYYYNAYNTAPGTSAPIPAPGYPDFKEVTVEVTWSDETGAPQKVRLDSIIAAVDPRRNGLVASATGPLYSSP